MEINRKVGPPIKRIDTIKMPEVTIFSLQNGIPVYTVDAGTQDVLKIEIVNRGSRLYEDVRLSSKAASYIMKEETKTRPSNILAEEIEFYGASIGNSHNLDYTSLLSYTLGKYKTDVIPIMSDIFFNPVFSEKELEKYISRNVNELKVSLTKNDVLAYREFTEMIYGTEHIYGYNSSAEMYQALNVGDCNQYFEDYIGTDNCVMFASGRITEEVKDLLNENFGHTRKSTFSKKYDPCTKTLERQVCRIKGKGDLQSSIIVGKRLFTKNHPDHAGIIVLNTILGGYFGSRLMKSVRENLGYTYGISSLYDVSRHDGFLYINTEVDPENADLTLTEIYRQIEILQQEKVPTGELEMVKNYILGNSLNMLDGPFRTSKWVKSLVMHDLSLLDGQKIFDKIKSITAEEIQELCCKYLKREELSELVVV